MQSSEEALSRAGQLPRFLALVGPSGSGKTHTATPLAKRLGYTVLHVGDALKECAQSLGFERQEVCGTQEEKLRDSRLWGVSGREFMQRFGTELCREQLPRVIPAMDRLWVRVLLHRLTLLPEGSKVVVEGVRFRDEVAALRARGAVIVQMRPRHAAATSDHPSEALTGICPDVFTDSQRMAQLIPDPPPRGSLQPGNCLRSPPSPRWAAGLLSGR